MSVIPKAALWTRLIGMHLLVEQVVVHFDLAVGFKVVWHQHHWYRHVAQLVNLWGGEETQGRALEAANGP